MSASDGARVALKAVGLGWLVGTLLALALSAGDAFAQAASSPAATTADVERVAVAVEALLVGVVFGAGVVGYRLGLSS